MRFLLLVLLVFVSTGNLQACDGLTQGVCNNMIGGGGTAYLVQPQVQQIYAAPIVQQVYAQPIVQQQVFAHQHRQQVVVQQQRQHVVRQNVVVQQQKVIQQNVVVKQRQPIIQRRSSVVVVH